jgi:hypothetical protein
MASYAHRVVRFLDGRVEADSSSAEPN